MHTHSYPEDQKRFLLLPNNIFIAGRFWHNFILAASNCGQLWLSVFRNISRASEEFRVRIDRCRCSVESTCLHRASAWRGASTCCSSSFAAKSCTHCIWKRRISSWTL
jgi:hypothetical protein